MEDREFIYAIKARLKYDADALNILLAEEFKLERKYRALQYSVEILIAEHILRETHKTGAVNGSNAEKRKLQTILFLDRLEEEDEEYSQLMSELEATEQELQETKMELKQAANTFSATKHQSRVIAAVLGGNNG